MLEKQKQNVGKNSTAIQVNGDLVLPSFQYQDIKTIFFDLFELNFPKLQKIASDKAKERVNEFLEVFFTFMNKHKNNIEIEKFAEPAIQFELQSIVINVGKRGKKSNYELLCDLLCTITSKDCPELIELIAGEALKILPKLNQVSFAYLSFEVFANEAKFSTKSPDEVNEFFISFNKHIDRLENLKLGVLQYLVSLGCIFRKGVRIIGASPDCFISVDGFKKSNMMESINLQEALDKSDELNLNNIKEFLNLSKKCSYGSYNLSATGRLIGWLNISKYSNIDYRNLF